VKSRALERTASSPAKRRPCWSQRPVRTRPKAAPAGRWNCWPMNWSGSPSMTTSVARLCAGAWRKTSSSPGARTCGASRRSMASSSPAWKMCSTSMLRNPIGSVRWSVSMKAPSSSARFASPSRPSRGSWSATTVSIAQWHRQPVHLP
jgi:hypothetical protein